MSEYQYIAFRAIDGPVSEKNLKFMRRQSSRAEVTPWSFDNEYHFGDFRGDSAEMLRRGYGPERRLTAGGSFESLSGRWLIGSEISRQCS